MARSLGLLAALAIGVGTMVGAGIFVFPGLAAGRAGPAATVSFALGGAIALLVAICTSELATAMPRSGGPYHFVTRGFGPATGAVVGLGQWFGLVFASAFYLVGAGHYVATSADALGLAIDVPTTWLGSAIAVALTGVNVLGARKAGLVQKIVVAILVALLAVFLTWGALRLTGVEGTAPPRDRPFAPHGVLPIVTTAALVFTSYLGFAQIAAVAGEIRRPERTIPRAIVGSVVVVTVLYVATMAVATALVPSDELERLGETALAEVGRRLAGDAGSALFHGCGALATISSANASILASSRALFALGQTRVLPDALGRVGRRFGTPHVALLAAGAPIGVLTLVGRVELLAEVASLLHLVLYGLLCFAVVRLRRDASEGYAPGFRAPGHPLVPVAGGLCSFVLVAFMGGASIAVGAGILVSCGVWYLVRSPGREAG